jgi:protein-S-isoprenylcysteine O-methyltransferase Ste14
MPDPAWAPDNRSRAASDAAMDLDHTFRMLMVVGFLLLFPSGVYYRLKSQVPRERLDRSHEGVFILATLRPLGLIFWAGMIAYMINPAWMAWSSMPLPAWLRWTAVAFLPLGAGLLVWTFHTLGPNLTDTVVTRRSHTLVTRGPYRFVRHPFYDSAAVLAVATSLMMANWFVLLTGVSVFLLLAVRSRTEEDMLLARFGDPYRSYRARTGRFLPKNAGETTQR